MEKLRPFLVKEGVAVTKGDRFGWNLISINFLQVLGGLSGKTPKMIMKVETG